MAGLWRYPVKSLAGESLAVATLTPGGIPGDRVVHVCGPEGVRTSRRHHRLLGLFGTLGSDGRPRINGHPWDSAEALALVKRAAGDDAWLEAHEGLERFDILPLLVATDGAVASFGRDVRRLRPNLLIGGVEGMAETHWPGGQLHIADALVRLDALRGRCPMTTIDPDTLERDPEVLEGYRPSLRRAARARCRRGARRNGPRGRRGRARSWRRDAVSGSARDHLTGARRATPRATGPRFNRIVFVGSGELSRARSDASRASARRAARRHSPGQSSG